MPSLVAIDVDDQEFDDSHIDRRTKDTEMGGMSAGKSTPALSWESVSYSVASGNKLILDNCTGAIYSGQVCAVLGPSGSGKTTLLDVIAGRVEKNRKGRSLSGDINMAPGTRMRYVQQEDSLCGILSVRETLTLATRLAGAPLSRAEDLLQELGLTVCQDTNVGTIFFKGISGGQKRRLSIAVELVSNPTLLLLDEPTSGLDSASALQVIQLLRAQCQTKELTVAMSIHQPSHEAWGLLDVVSFMTSGKVVYFGSSGDHLLSFLRSAGHPVPQHANVADHCLTLINSDFVAVGVKVAEVSQLVAAFAALPPDPGSPRREIKGADASSQGTSNGSQGAGWLTRFAVLLERDAKEMLRDPGILGVRLTMYGMLSVLIGLMFWDIGSDNGDSAVVARVSILFYVAAFMVFMSVAVLPFFVMQRGLFVKERCNGAYGVPEYVLAKFAVSLPGIFLLSASSGLIIVLCSGLNGLVVYITALFFSLLWAEAFMCLMAALVPHYIIGIALAAGAFGFFMLCQGFFKLKKDIPPYLIWGYHMAPHTYTFRVFMHNEFHPIKKLDSVFYEDGDAVLKFYGMSDVDVESDLVVLAVVTVGLQIIFALVLQYLHTGKR
mmetsp:Transcript_59169/g.118763  ORF Transcript_59169/g.118763 Transcript_59169/m.118763 type:complete len:607 (-) Transcript_59169:230-2050(-)